MGSTSRLPKALDDAMRNGHVMMTYDGNCPTIPGGALLGLSAVLALHPDQHPQGDHEYSNTLCHEMRRLRTARRDAYHAYNDSLSRCIQLVACQTSLRVRLLSDSSKLGTGSEHRSAGLA